MLWKPGADSKYVYYGRINRRIQPIDRRKILTQYYLAPRPMHTPLIDLTITAT